MNVTWGAREMEVTWGAYWLLPVPPETYRAAWGARGIADKEWKSGKPTGNYIVSLLADRQAGAGENQALKELLFWVNKKVLPINMYYDGASTKVTSIDEGAFHARYTPNGSYGYVYIIAWVD